jgi:hypothetical protein
LKDGFPLFLADPRLAEWDCSFSHRKF